MVLEGCQNGIRDASDTDLEGRSIRNHFGDMASDGSIYLGRDCRRDFHKRVIHLNGSINARDMDQGIAI